MEQVVLLVYRVKLHNVVAYIQLSEALYLSVNLLVHFWMMNLIRFYCEELFLPFCVLRLVKINDGLSTPAESLHMVVANLDAR